MVEYLHLSSVVWNKHNRTSLHHFGNRDAERFRLTCLDAEPAPGKDTGFAFTSHLALREDPVRVFPAKTSDSPAIGVVANLAAHVKPQRVSAPPNSVQNCNGALNPLLRRN